MNGTDSNPATGTVWLLAPDPGFRNNRATLMANTLAGAGYRVTLHVGEVCLRPAGLDGAVEMVADIPRHIDTPGTGAGALEVLDFSRVDLVQVVGPGLLHWATARLPAEIPLVYDVPGGGTEPVVETGEGWAARAGKLWNRLRVSLGERQEAGRIDAVLCPGYLYGEFLQREFKLGRVPVVPIYPAHPYQEPEARAPKGWARRGRHVAAVLGGDAGNLEAAIHAVARLRELDLAVVNGGGDWEQAHGWANGCGMNGRLHRINVPETEVLSTLAAFDVGLVLSADNRQTDLYDPPDALFSFLMAGLPVVASDLPGLERMVAAHNFGLVTDPGSVDHVSDNLARVCLEPAVHGRLAHNVAVVRERRYSWEVQGNRLLALYRQLLSERAGTAFAGSG